MTEIDPNHRLLSDLTPDIETLYERHMQNTRIWYPHEFVPYSMGVTFEHGEEWDPHEYPLPDAVRSSILVNLLTEDNLPYYYETINAFSPDRDHPWGVWARQWTSEEDRHSTVIREWTHVTRAIDPRLLEDARRPQVAGGQVPIPGNLTDLLAYTTLQELATRVAHGNTGKELDKERGGKDVMAQVAADEALHHVFYRDLSIAALRVDPSVMVISIAKQIRNFAMPGTGIPDFKTHAKAIADAGIYDFVKFKESVVDPSMKRWKLEEVTGLSDEAEVARDGLFKHIAKLEKVAKRMRRNQQEIQELASAT